MSAKIHHSALLLAVVISLIYFVCWIPFALFFDKIFLFSVDHQIEPANLQFLIGFLYLSITSFMVFVLMKNQVRQTAELHSRLMIADETMETRVKLRTDEIEKLFTSIKRLNGIIPICAHCKNIRNGSGRWEKLEAYFQKRTDAEFSHGLCPECDKALYGDRRLHFESIARKYTGENPSALYPEVKNF